MLRKLPIGIQSFEKLRTDHFLYVDKTALVYDLAHYNVPYFLSRPRRFGKSLLLSTLKAYWEGKKELFDGLAIEQLEEANADAWQPYPVFYFDFNGANYHTTSIETVFDGMLQDWEELYGDRYKNRPLGERFQKLLELAAEKTGKRCVVLVDEYDKPLLDMINQPELQSHIKEVVKGVFSQLKKSDAFLKFVFITGVTKFHKVSIFSDLNQLMDISLVKKYSTLCGLTEKEILKYFDPELLAFSLEKDLTKNECLLALQKKYDGYRFAYNSERIYNPFSLLSSLFQCDYGSFWFETGTPTFLIKKLRESSFDLRKLTNGTLYASEASLKDYTGDNLEPIPLLYQTGYLTIKDYDDLRKRYTLCFPNEEVQYGFLESLLPSYVPTSNTGNGLDIFTLDDYIENGRLDDLRSFFTALFAGITYTLESDPFEHYFQAVIYLVFTLLGKYVLCEMHTYTGRIDCKVQTADFIYLFEFKRDDTATNALAQINSKDYSLPFIADSRKLYKIGVSFDAKERKLAGWEVGE